MRKGECLSDGSLDVRIISPDQNSNQMANVHPQYSMRATSNVSGKYTTISQTTPPRFTFYNLQNMTYCLFVKNVSLETVEVRKNIYINTISYHLKYRPSDVYIIMNC